MRALVISDTHFGAWTGDDLLCRPEHRERLAAHLGDVDEVIFLGDLFDFLFGRVGDGFAHAEGLLELLADRLRGRRLVFLPGNHDHHLVVRDGEAELDRRLLDGTVGGGRAGGGGAAATGFAFVRAYLERRLAGVEVEIAYPTYRFGDVLLAHGHFLDPHARRAGSTGSRLLTRALWSIAAGGPDDPRTLADYEATTTLLTEWLFAVAQLPHGTTAQRNVFELGQRAARATARLSAPRRRIAELARRGQRAGRQATAVDAAEAESVLDPAHLERARVHERARRRRRGIPLGHRSPAHVLARTHRPADPRQRALDAFAESVARLGWDREAEQIVFAHTHQPLAGVAAERTPGVRYWNTGCWFYEPELSSPAVFTEYLRKGWPGTAVLIDTAAPEPRLLELLADLNPLAGGPGLASEASAGAA